MLRDNNKLYENGRSETCGHFQKWRRDMWKKFRVLKFSGSQNDLKLHYFLQILFQSGVDVHEMNFRIYLQNIDKNVPYDHFILYICSFIASN